MRQLLLSRAWIAGYALLVIAILAVPVAIDDPYLLNKFARYLIFAMLAVALSLSWGYTGILNLGQAVSFGLGSYCMAMALKLKTMPIQTGTGGLPDFMVWNNVPSLPWFWQPFHSIGFAIAAGIAVPVGLALILGWFIFRARVAGVYVSIITLALLVIINLLIVDQQRFTGGFNGLTDLSDLQVMGIDFDPYSAATYYLAAAALILSLIVGLAIINSKTGLIMQAIRDDETRVRYFGYDVAAYQIFALSVSAGISGVAGMLYAVVMAFASPTFMSVQLSLSIVIWCAVGGRASLIGAAIGALLVTGIQGSLSETPIFLNTWLLIMGALFVAVVLLLPKGLISLVQSAITLFSRPVADRTATPVNKTMVG